MLVTDLRTLREAIFTGTQSTIAPSLCLSSSSLTLIFLWMTQEVITLEMESPLPRAESAKMEMLTWERPR